MCRTQSATSLAAAGMRCKVQHHLRCLHLCQPHWLPGSTPCPAASICMSAVRGRVGHAPSSHPRAEMAAMAMPGCTVFYRSARLPWLAYRSHPVHFFPFHSALNSASPFAWNRWAASPCSQWQSSLAAGMGAGYSPVTIAALIAAVAAVVAYTAPSSDLQAGGGPPVPEDALATDYDADFVAAYWARRPGAVSVRSVQVLAAALRVGSGLLLDAARGRSVSCQSYQHLASMTMRRISVLR